MTKTTLIEHAWLEYQQQLLSFVRTKVDSTEDAEELVNDVFLKLTKMINNDTIPQHISGWLYRVTKNHIVDYYRSRKDLVPVSDDLTEAHEESNIIQQLSHCLLPMLKDLPDIYQQPLHLSEIEGKQYKQIATELNLTVPAIKSRILRGRKKLLKSMTHCCTLYQNDKGETVNYEKKPESTCHHC
jgi:RNA polymerase sigma-70 factor (ECF subfamily)